MSCETGCPCCHGACCTDGSCQAGVNCYDCEAEGGEWQGAGSTCDPDPCEAEDVCCCCDDGTDITCYTLTAGEGADCVTGVEDPIFGNLFGDWTLCTFSQTPGPCQESPIDAFSCPSADDCCEDEGLVSVGVSGGGQTLCCPEDWEYDAPNLSCNPPGYEDPP